MTSDKTPADTVTEAAAKVGAEAIYWTLEWEQLDDATRSDAIEFARALGDAGLLATPADQGEPTDLDRFIGAISDPLYLQGYLQGYQNGYKHAEAERDELEHRLACLLCELTGGLLSKTNYDVPTMVQEVEAYFERTVDDDVTELRATIDRVRAIHEPIDAVMNPGPRERIVKVCTGCGTDDGNWQRWPCPTVRALDGAGERQ